jgi:hypothetical protein
LTIRFRNSTGAALTDLKVTDLTSGRPIPVPVTPPAPGQEGETLTLTGRAYEVICISGNTTATLTFQLG